MNNLIVALNKIQHLKSCGTIAISVIFILAMASGCTQWTQQSVKKQPAQKEQTLVKNKTNPTNGGNEKTPRIIHEKSSAHSKGTNIKILVNGYPITSYDIKQRAAFLKLRRISGNRGQKAREELIEDQLKMQEAKKYRIVASDDTVNRALADFSRSNQLTVNEMKQVLRKAGISINHFREFLRGQISWQRAVGAKFQNSTKKLSQSDALFNIRKSGEDKPKSREYKLQQIIFVVPQKKRRKLLHLRLAEAHAFAQRFTGCDNTISQAKMLRDVSVKKLGRILEPELPPLWKQDVIKTVAGKTTRPKKTETGVEILAVCSMRNISDDRTAQIVTQSKEFDSLNRKGDKFAKKYLQELRTESTIIYR